MSSSFEVLSRVRHQELRHSPIPDYRFAAKQLLVPVVVSEIAEVVREFPIVFPRDLNGPYALMGLQDGRNAYVSPQDGRWLADYVPWALRLYPFALSQPSSAATASAKNTKYALLVDPTAPQFKAGNGDALFDDSGKPTPLVQAHLDALKEFQQARQLTEALTDLIAREGLLSDRDPMLKRTDGSSVRLSGARVIDAAKLKTLGTDAVQRLWKAAPLLYAQIFSMANLRRGLLADAVPVK